MEAFRNTSPYCLHCIHLQSQSIDINLYRFFLLLILYCMPMQTPLVIHWSAVHLNWMCIRIKRYSLHLTVLIYFVTSFAVILSFIMYLIILFSMIINRTCAPYQLYRTIGECDATSTKWTFSWYLFAIFPIVEFSRLQVNEYVHSRFYVQLVSKSDFCYNPVENLYLFVFE